MNYDSRPYSNRGELLDNPRQTTSQSNPFNSFSREGNRKDFILLNQEISYGNIYRKVVRTYKNVSNYISNSYRAHTT